MATNKYLTELIRIAREDMPALEYTIQNGSTTLALREAVEKLFNAVRVLMYHVITESVPQRTQSTSPGPIAPAPTAAPTVAPSPPVAVPVARPVALPVPSASDAFLPPLPGTAAHAASQNPVIPDVPNASIQPGVTNVVITSQGTHVVAPSGARAVLPPGAPVDLATSTGAPPELPPAPPGVDQVVLPPGGGMSPEVAAALAGRSVDQPPQ